MNMETKHPSGDPVARPPAQPDPSVRYETRDADVFTLAKFGFGLAVILVVIFFGMRWTFDRFAKVQKLGPPVSPFEEGNIRTLPPAPRLQVVPQSDLLGYCEKQRQTLASYGWVDRSNGVVRVPIDQAMETLLARGLPVRAGSENAASSQVESHSESVAPSAGMDVGPCGYLLEAEAAKVPSDEREKSGAPEAEKKE